jgi:hypothetical protein
VGDAKIARRVIDDPSSTSHHTCDDLAPRALAARGFAV